MDVNNIGISNIPFLAEQCKKEFGTLVIVGYIKFEGSISILFVYDDAVVQPHHEASKVFDKTLDNLSGAARKEYVLKYSQKRDLGGGRFDSQTKCVDLSEGGLFPARGIACICGARSIQGLIKKELLEKLNEANTDDIAKFTREKMIELLKANYSKKKEGGIKQIKGTVLLGQFDSISSKCLIHAIEVDSNKFVEYKRVRKPRSIEQCEAFGLASNEAFVLEWMKNIFGENDSMMDKNWSADELRTELRRLGENVPAEYKNFLGVFEAFILRLVPPNDKNGLVCIKAQGN